MWPLIRAFRLNGDVYSSFASTIYNRPINKMDNPKERQVGKTCILGLGYGMGPDKFRARIKLDAGVEIDENEAKRIVYLYRETYSGIKALWDNASALLPQMAQGYEGIPPFAPFLKIKKNRIVLPSGLSIQYPNLRYAIVRTDHGDRKEWFYDVYKKKNSEPVKLYGGKLIENISQALAGEITKIAIESAQNKSLSVVGQVHDEIITVSDEDSASRDAILLRQSMELPLSWWTELNLVAEVGVGDNWYEAKA